MGVTFRSLEERGESHATRAPGQLNQLSRRPNWPRASAADGREYFPEV